MESSPEDAERKLAGRHYTLKISPELSTGMMHCELTLEEDAHRDVLYVSDCPTWQELVQ